MRGWILKNPVVDVFLWLVVVEQQTLPSQQTIMFHSSKSLSRGELGNSLGSLTDGMLGKLTRKHKTDGGLDFSGRKSSLLVVGGKLSSLTGDTLKDIIDERVHDGHTLLGDTSVGVDLLQDTVDVSSVGFGTLLALLATGRGLLGGLGRFSRLLGWSLSHGRTKTRNRTERRRGNEKDA